MRSLHGDVPGENQFAPSSSAQPAQQHGAKANLGRTRSFSGILGFGE
jgi:hypothetical protein